MKIIFLLFFLFFLSLTSFSQILNIEQNRIHEDSSDLAGWHAEAKFSFESTEDNEDNIIDANASLNLKYVQNIYICFWVITIS